MKFRHDRRPVVASRGFTLVELLVVIGIIALLIALLLPALNKAREQAKRVQCASNLRTMGQVCHMFAQDHKGYFPFAWSYGQDQYSFEALTFPALLSYDPNNDDNSDTWKRFGTPYQTFLRYGKSPADDQITYLNGGTTALTRWMVCPNSEESNFQAWTNIGGGYGSGIEIGYAFFGGLPYRKLVNPPAPESPNQPGSFAGTSYAITVISGYNWGTRTPAVRISDKGDRILAADVIWWEGNSGQGSGYVINHMKRGSGTQSDFQNILFADGRVEGVRPVFTDSVTGKEGTVLTASNWTTAFQASGPFQGRYFYVGQK